MTSKQIPRSRLSFSQGEGIEPLPQPLALEELPGSARNLLWSFIYQTLVESRTHDGFSYTLGDPWQGILYDYRVYFLYQPADEFSVDFGANIDELKDLFINQPYNKVFDFIQFVLRHRGAPRDSFEVVKKILEKFMCAYTIVEDGPTIIPITSPEQGATIHESFEVLASGPFEGAQAHFRKSAECLSTNDLAGSVRESIHAIESVARRLDEGATTSLKPALEALIEKGMTLHPAFKKGVENLYGYTSDENGIRHALLEGNADVDIEDAVFMYGACASFSSFLINKARKSKLLE